jgi:uncharacterized membrane protein (UPF0127 family)
VAASFLVSILSDPNARWVLRNARHAGIVASSIETAFDSPTRNKGLLGRPGLADGHALILAPCSSIHTFFMQFAIDVAFVDRNGVVLRVRKVLGPWRLQIALRAFAVIEFASGNLDRSDTRTGDRLYLAAE